MAEQAVLIPYESDYLTKKEQKRQRDELVVSGYIREAQQTEVRQQLIPTTITSICTEYHHIPLEPPKWTGISRRILKELKDIQRNPLTHTSTGPINYNLSTWKANMLGPPESPYHGGVFTLNIKIPPEYPHKPPKVNFETKIYHCGVNKRGFTCLDILSDNWSPALTISKILESVYSYLTDPPDFDPLVPEIAKLYRSNRKLHDKIAREWTLKYAQ